VAVQEPIFSPLSGRSVNYYRMLGLLLALVVAGLGAAHFMDVNGHWVTGMNNHVVWGLPHVFAIFLILLASGVLNVAALASVFRIDAYKPMARVSAGLAICLLLGGLAVLVLDLGRPERIIEAMTYYNFRSVFTWNVFLYTGFIGVCAAYLVTMMNRPSARWNRTVGKFALVWRFVLTSGTGLIFGFLVARNGYDAALLAPLFVVLSLSIGMAVFLIVAMVFCHLGKRPLAPALIERMARLLVQLALVALYLTAVMHVANNYVQEHVEFERFVLTHGGYAVLFWVGYVLFGTLVPVALLYSPMRESRGMVLAAASLVALGGWSLVYVIVIAGQAFPVDVLHGYEVVSSTFMDGQIAPYSPSLPEWLLGLGGVAFGILAFAALARVLPLFPDADAVAPPP
tara:strand:- start:1463 stop:2659 length:1197 start_codon:yes stop_codon:yes gene_type:complete